MGPSNWGAKANWGIWFVVPNKLPSKLSALAIESYTLEPFKNHHFTRYYRFILYDQSQHQNY